ncbi:hypothetical protein D0962_13605 [Leptolyngbyaceae cyanobacterium CCMR0082]|uniref:Uncharacterized protein n=2 Tax=Adonisia turfae TaxID=2950184 RepID=A0A6M0S621_9CYAN|nr:hypothetical protein [Adonisia turfae]MDV3353543.1 hypothetical protein [Leptothoe sp. LEGE 181152]NEZ56801.1 hypothetical protein [Adonisia turfae CCMR0081]NEZ63810.1 hypothetical protein [Adonisia turfae CCMR0082]
MKPKFSTLILLTLASALLLLPFAISPIYLDALRDRSVELHQFIRGEIYKQVTGYVALAFVVFEMLLSLRKRGRSWLGKIKLPGSVMLWRSVHIFLGVGLLAIVVVHTIGATGLNFNYLFLWVFFAVTLSALVGVVAETGILESPRKFFGVPGNKDLVMTKGPLIRNMRAVWLPTHIFLVSVFILMLGVHVFLAYYYR